MPTGSSAGVNSHVNTDTSLRFRRWGSRSLAASLLASIPRCVQRCRGADLQSPKSAAHPFSRCLPRRSTPFGPCSMDTRDTSDTCSSLAPQSSMAPLFPLANGNSPDVSSSSRPPPKLFYLWPAWLRKQDVPQEGIHLGRHVADLIHSQPLRPPSLPVTADGQRHRCRLKVPLLQYYLPTL